MVDVEIKVGTTGLPDIDDKLGAIDAAKFKAYASPSREFWKSFSSNSSLALKCKWFMVASAPMVAKKLEKVSR